jgi:RNA polymerase sigma-70 factor, ECF subfamily
VPKVTLTESSKTNDLHLIEQAQQDPEQFRKLYERYFKQIFVFIHHRVRDKAITADLTSQVFLKALLNLKKYRYQGVPFSAWLYRIALNECYSFFRSSRHQRVVSVDSEVLQELYKEMIAEAEPDDLAEKLPAILDQLDKDELHMLELRFFESRPFREVGAILGITENYAKIKVYRLLDKMKRLFLARSTD